MTVTTLISLILSVIGAFLGALTFYLTQMRKANVLVIIENRVRIGYAEGGKGFHFIVPVTFINHTNQTGVVTDIKLSICAKYEPEGTYQIKLGRFSKIDESKRLVDTDLPHPVDVTGKSSVHKLLKFSWWNASEPAFVMDRPEYRMTFSFSFTNKAKPLLVSEDLKLSDQALQALRSFREQGSGSTIEVPLGAPEPNNVFIKQT